jgi:hypothetical protein
MIYSSLRSPGGAKSGYPTHFPIKEFQKKGISNKKEAL